MKKTGLYWFRNNLRLRDNPSLVQAVKSCDNLLPVYVINEKLLGSSKLGFASGGPFRMKFLHECLADLKRELQEIGGDLLVVVGNPVQAIQRLASKHGIGDIYCTNEVDFYEVQELKALAEDYNVHTEFDQLLLTPDLLQFRVDELPLVFTKFRKSAEKNMAIRPELPAPAQLEVINEDYEFRHDHGASPQMDRRSAFPFSGGESKAWKRLNDYAWNSKRLAQYKNTRNGLVGKDYSSKFSPYLAAGCISPVSIYNEVKKFEKEHIKNISTYWLVFELLWREFFKFTSWKYGKLIFSKGGILNNPRTYNNNMSTFQNWIDGKTADDFVNANMTELKHTGFMSNRGRQNVASYLAHDLDIDWRWGAEYFESQLIDYDCASNWCNWMYVAGVGNDPRSRKFNTRLQADRYDSKGRYRSLWLQPGLFN